MPSMEPVFSYTGILAKNLPISIRLIRETWNRPTKQGSARWLYFGTRALYATYCQHLVCTLARCNGPPAFKP
jgi:hypothetical protein